MGTATPEGIPHAQIHIVYSPTVSGARAGILVPRGPVMSNLSFLTEVHMHHQGGPLCGRGANHHYASTFSLVTVFYWACPGVLSRSSRIKGSYVHRAAVPPRYKRVPRQCLEGVNQRCHVVLSPAHVPFADRAYRQEGVQFNLMRGVLSAG